MSEWSTEFPTEEGWYWFYGHRYGLNGNGKLASKPELCTVKILAIPKGVVRVADGHFMYESEVLYPHFKKMDVPSDLPTIEYKDGHDAPV